MAGGRCEPAKAQPRSSHRWTAGTLPHGASGAQRGSEGSPRAAPERCRQERHSAECPARVAAGTCRPHTCLNAVAGSCTSWQHSSALHLLGTLAHCLSGMLSLTLGPAQTEPLPLRNDASCRCAATHAVRHAALARLVGLLQRHVLRADRATLRRALKPLQQPDVLLSVRRPHAGSTGQRPPPTLPAERTSQRTRSAFSPQPRRRHAPRRLQAARATHPAGPAQLLTAAAAPPPLSRERARRAALARAAARAAGSRVDWQRWRRRRMARAWPCTRAAASVPSLRSRAGCSARHDLRELHAAHAACRAHRRAACPAPTAPHLAGRARAIAHAVAAAAAARARQLRRADRALRVELRAAVDQRDDARDAPPLGAA